MSAILAGVLTAAFAALLAISAPALAQQAGPVNPTAQSVKEQQLLDALKPGGTIQARPTIPDAKAGTLMQPAGRDYQGFQQGTLKTVGGVALLGMLVILVGFYFTRGKITVDSGLAGRTITRFGGVERFIHWLTAVCFLILAVSGLNLVFGRGLVLPIVGEGAFGVWSQWLKYAHNYLAFPFMLGLALMFLAWVKDNIPSGRDVAWIKAGGGIVGKGHPPAKRFNAGQKMVFWMVVIGGLALSVSGWFMLFPFENGRTIADQQWWQSVHGVVGVLLIAAMLAHIYIGSIGMEGAFDAMGSGEVDLNWAKEHHSLWVAETAGQAGAAPGKMLPAE